jgi:DNA-3-methyladenine glycosylase
VNGAKLPRAFYARDTRAVARGLLGKVLVHRDGGLLRAARIVETEAYHGPDDLASHARAGPTARAGIMFGPPGVAYVYLIYGRSHCMNVVTGPEGFPSAVLIRGAEPVAACLHTTRGPGNLCRALGIRRDQDNGRDLLGDDLFLVDDGGRVGRIVSGPRINVAYAGRWAGRPWRWAVAGNPWVTRPAPGRRLIPARGSGPAATARPSAAKGRARRVSSRAARRPRGRSAP